MRELDSEQQTAESDVRRFQRDNVRSVDRDLLRRKVHARTRRHRPKLGFRIERDSHQGLDVITDGIGIGHTNRQGEDYDRDYGNPKPV